MLVLVVNYDVPNHHEDYVHRWEWSDWLFDRLFDWSLTGSCAALALVVNYDVLNHTWDYVRR